MKKILTTAALFTAAACMTAQLGAYAADTGAEHQDVEISFKIGDDTLLINGTETQVEKPYVVGEGVTLVPLRVITEAFGAEVEWNGEDKSITLSYPGIDILLQIDNPTAEVNKKAQTLLSAPELTEAGFTMVPLRFISETFGAEVSWDDATQSVLVTKKAETEEKLVEGAISEANIGDSYYKWTMENPKDMYMSQRDFDGTYTSFELDDDNWIYISVSPISEDYDFDKDFSDTKDSLKGHTLVKADKDTSGNIKKMHFQARDKEEFRSIKSFVTKEYIIDIVGGFDNTNAEQKDKYLKLMDTFTCSYNGKDTYDLSNIVDGSRKFEPENCNFSIMIPQEYCMSTDEDSTNLFGFRKLAADDDMSRISIAVYSKSDVGGAKDMAEGDYKNNVSGLNEKLFTFTDVKENKYGDIDVYEYSYTASGTKDQDEYMRDVFFEKGEYVFNVSVSVKLPDENAQSKADKIFASMTAGEPDAEKLGILMRNIYDSVGTYTSKAGSWTLTLPNSFKEQGVSADSAFYVDAATVTVLSMSKLNDVNNLSDVKKNVQNIEQQYKNSDGTTIVESSSTKTLGKWSFATFTMRTETDEIVAYRQMYATYNRGKATIFIVTYPERAYSAANIEKVQNILSTYTEN